MLILAQLAEPKLVKNRVHLDLRGDDSEAELARLVACSRRTRALTLLADPEGNEFCLLR